MSLLVAFFAAVVVVATQPSMLLVCGRLSQSDPLVWSGLLYPLVCSQVSLACLFFVELGHSPEVLTAASLHFYNVLAMVLWPETL